MVTGGVLAVLALLSEGFRRTTGLEQLRRATVFRGSLRLDGEFSRRIGPMLADLIGAPTTLDDVVATMRAIDARLPDGDGVKWFNFLYLEVTKAVQADRDAWKDWPFLQRFDVRSEERRVGKEGRWWW